jgi:uncharacterized Zn finger protein (UPF0148 family)
VTSPPDPSLCPKCGTPLVTGAAACATCGLAIAKMAGYIEARDMAVPDAMREAWTHTTEHWEAAAAHDQLLRLTVSNNCFAWTAGRYRRRDRDAIAERSLERLRRAAEVTLMASATARRDEEARPYRAVTSVLAVLIAVIIAGLLYAMIRDRGAPATAGPPPSAPPHTVQPLQPGHPVSSSTIK